MPRVMTAHSVSVDGYLSGRDAAAGNGLGEAKTLFDWYFDGDTPSGVFNGFKLSAASQPIFDELAGRVGASVAGRATYEHSSRFGSGGPHPTAPLVVVSDEAIEVGEHQTLVTTGIEDAIAKARELAGDKDVSVMGGATATAALQAGLVDEVVLHQIPILLGGGRPFFRELPEQIRLELKQAVPADGVTHLHYEVIR